MDMMVLLLLLGFIGCMITTIILQIIGGHRNTTIISSLTMVLYGIYILISAFYPYQGVSVGLDTIGVCYMTGIMVIIGWKMLTSKKSVLIWMMMGAVVSILALIAQLNRYKESSMINNMVDFGVLFIIGIFILTLIALIKKNSGAQILIKTLMISYLVETVLFSVLPPLQIINMIISLIIMILVGAIPAIILIWLYKKFYVGKGDTYAIGDDL